MTPFKLLATQAQSANRYKILKTKVAECCANIHFVCCVVTEILGLFL